MPRARPGLHDGSTSPLVFTRLPSLLCSNLTDPKNWVQRGASRCTENMRRLGNVTASNWRKSRWGSRRSIGARRSGLCTLAAACLRWLTCVACVSCGLPLPHRSQWFMLQRRHAELVAADVGVDAAFRADCWTATDWWEPGSRFCASDEHYVPTLLAVHGRDAETACSDAVMYTRWNGASKCARGLCFIRMRHETVRMTPLTNATSCTRATCRRGAPTDVWRGCGHGGRAAGAAARVSGRRMQRQRAGSLQRGSSQPRAAACGRLYRPAWK